MDITIWLQMEVDMKDFFGEYFTHHLFRASLWSVAWAQAAWKSTKRWLWMYQWSYTYFWFQVLEGRTVKGKMDKNGFRQQRSTIMESSFQPTDGDLTLTCSGVSSISIISSNVHPQCRWFENPAWLKYNVRCLQPLIVLVAYNFGQLTVKPLTAWKLVTGKI